MKHILKLITLTLTSMIILLSISSCNDNDTSSAEVNSKESSSSQIEKTSDIWSNAKYTSDTELGDGKKTIQVEVKAEEKTVIFTIHTDKSVLADALSEHKLISGDNSEYGIYIKEVNGITADYDIDKSFWTISKDGVSLAVGADSTKISDGEHYEFTYTKEQ